LGAQDRGMIVDISLTISPEMVVWPSDPHVEIVPTSRLARGDHANVSQLKLGTHTGTHVDPPFHFIDGAPGVDALSLDQMNGECVVVDARAVARDIGAGEVRALVPMGAQRVLFRTRNSEIWARESPAFTDDYVAVTPEGARELVARGVRVVGVDFLSVEHKGAPGHPTHVALLEAGAIIVEGLDLSKVEPGPYRFICAPLKIKDGDGAPARAALETL
jgi:arylformamidase